MGRALAGPGAGRGGAGGGAGWRPAPAQKAELPGGGARAVRGADGAPETARGNPDPEEPLVLARPDQALRYGVPLGPALGSVLQSGRC